MTPVITYAVVKATPALGRRRYYLNGLLLVLEPSGLKVVATDGLAYVAHDFAGQAGRQELILPRKAVLELVKLLADSDDPVRLELLTNQVRFSFDRVVLVSKVIDDLLQMTHSTHECVIEA